MAEQELVIEEAQREDAASLARLLETVALESDFLAQDDRSSILSVEQLATYIESHQHRLNEICLVAKLGHEVIGVCNVTSDQDTKTSHIGDVFIAVSKPYWGNGVGQFLMETMIDWADHTPTIRRLELTVRRKILLMLLAIFATTVVAAGIYLTTTYNYATGELSKTFRASKATSGNSKAIQQTKPITILLMGVDTGSKERKETWEGNSDTMILVTVNPKTKKTTMTSLERDLLTDIEGSGEAKLNSAYAEGGADLAISTIQKVLDIDIDYYALAVSSNVQTSIDLGDTNTLRSLMGYSDALKNIKSYQLAGSDAMINGGSYQVASTEDILKVQNRIKQEVGKKKVSESNLKTSLVLYGSGSSNYGSDDFVNSKGSAASSEASSNYEGGTSEAAGGGSVSTYNGGTTYSNNYSENTGNYVQEQGTTTPTYNNNGSGVTTYSTVPAAQ